MTFPERPRLLKLVTPIEMIPLITIPKCLFCGTEWTPSEGVVADQTYCPNCREQRRKIAQEYFNLQPLTEVDFDGDYLLPRRLFDFPEDIVVIQHVLASHGVEVSDEIAEEIWLDISNEHSAGWLCLPSHDVLWEMLKSSKLVNRN
jgi:hypothetical protein